MIQFENVNLHRNDQLVLKDISFSLSEKRVAIIGANGSGKSSLVRLINGLLTPQNGRVLIDGMEVHKEGKKARRRVGFLFQNPEHQIVLPIVCDDVALALKNRGINKQERLLKVNKIMQSMGIEHLCNRSSHTLSGGEKQLVALAGILIGNPEILVMDEPSTLLDLRHFNHLKIRIAKLEQQLIIVTHNMELAELCERVLVLNEGELVYDGLPQLAIPYYQKMMVVT
jgi:biotin transport system ATP-binding protein